jgi:hypothetical protein
MPKKLGTPAKVWQQARSNLTYTIQSLVALLEFVLILPFFGMLAVHIIASLAFVLTLVGIGAQRLQDSANKREIKSLRSELATTKDVVTEFAVPYTLRDVVDP